VVPGTPASGASAGVTLQDNQSVLNLAAVFNYASLTVSNQGGYDDIEQYEWCTFSYSGLGGGAITGSVGSLSFTGTFENGSSWGESSMTNGQLGGNIYYFDSSFDLSFQGIWSNGWNSTGVLSGYGNVCFSESDCYPGHAWVDITTMTPEPPSLALLGAGLFPIISALRRKLLR
jgi:hypothetical protein